MLRLLRRGKVVSKVLGRVDVARKDMREDGEEVGRFK
jgi:hypothetical protein